MATSQTDTFLVDDVKVCSICFEKFKTPRYLPCKHSFCHGCLHSYIVTQCKSTEPRLGFHCPLCRMYIPSHGDPEKPEEWATLYPINDVLQKLVAGPDIKYCEPCLRDNEKEESSDYCLTCNEYLCMLCAKCHKKNMASRDHITIKISEMLYNQITPGERLSYSCPKHEHENIQLYCHDHEKLCCGLCGVTEHRKCKRVDTLDNAVHFLKESGEMDSLLCKVNKFRTNLLKVKTEEMNNISEIESTVDEIVANTEGEASALVQHIEHLKKKHIDEMFLTLKEGRGKVQREIDKIEDGVFCVDNCKEEIEKAQGAENNIEMIMKFCTAKESFHKLKQVNFRHINVNITAEMDPSWMDITTNMNRIADVKLSASFRLFKLNIISVDLFAVKAFVIKNCNIYYGLFLSKERFLFVNYNGDNAGLVYDKHWDCIHVFDGITNPYGAVQFEEEIFVTSTASNTIHVFSSDHFNSLRKFHIEGANRNWGITCWRENLYIACVTYILKIDKLGHILKKYDVNGSHVLHIKTTKCGLIVYSDWKLETVTAMTDEGCEVWKYQTSNLKHPRELEVDSSNNIYIAGKDSNNIHVLTSSGNCIRVIENILTPMFCKINEDAGIMCVCSGGTDIKIYQLQITD